MMDIKYLTEVYITFHRELSIRELDIHVQGFLEHECNCSLPVATTDNNICYDFRSNALFL